MSPLRIGLVGPDQTQPCGIADYTARLRAVLADKCDLTFVPFREAMDSGALSGCRAILVQYERSLVPDPEFLPKLSARHPGRVYAVPHEVYAEDPFAFPYADLRAAFPPVLWLKRLRYRWTHRAYAREKRLQARGYGAHRVIPLSGPGRDILRALAGDRILDPVPHAYFLPHEAASAAGASAAGVPDRADFFPRDVQRVLGIFGFLNPGLDYGVALDLLLALDGDVGLLILGGPRAADRGMAAPSEPGQGSAPAGHGPDKASSPGQNGPVRNGLYDEAEKRGLQGRVRVTGYIPESDLDRNLRLCDLFLAPMRFKSNSGALLHLFGMGKPILAADLPLTRYLLDQGAPLVLYQTPDDLRAKVQAALRPGYPVLPNRYPWSFPAVAEAYLRILASTPD